jgi:putative ABC transport system permease protein
MEGGFSTELAGQLAALPEVDAVSAYRNAPAEVDGSSVMLDAVDIATIDEVFDLQVSAGAVADVGEGTIAINSDAAAKRGLDLGDTVVVRFASGEAQMQVVALYDNQFPEGGYLVDNATLEAHVTDQYDKKVFVSIDDSVEAAAAREAIEEILEGYPNAELLDQSGFKEDITSGIDEMLNLIYGLLGLAVVIALIGIANTLALSVHERRREIGLLRAVGMTRGRVRSTVRRESVLIALLGTGLGTVLAVGSASGIVKALGDDVTVFEVPPAQLSTIAGLAAVAGVLAAFGPARRASNLDVLDALAE